MVMDRRRAERKFQFFTEDLWQPAWKRCFWWKKMLWSWKRIFRWREEIVVDSLRNAVLEIVLCARENHQVKFVESQIRAYLWPIFRICRNKRTGCLIFRSNKKTFQNPSVLCTPPFEKSPIKPHRFCVLPPLKDHPSKPLGFVYSPLWKITHQSPSVLCTPFFGKWLFLEGAYFGVGVYFGKDGKHAWKMRTFCSWTILILNNGRNFHNGFFDPRCHVRMALLDKDFNFESPFSDIVVQIEWTSATLKFIISA